MKALVFEEPRRAVVSEREIPAIAADEVLVRSRNVGICHSDFELYEGRYVSSSGMRWSHDDLATKYSALAPLIENPK